jgi:lipid-binding SYLF domain-containing protein
MISLTRILSACLLITIQGVAVAEWQPEEGNRLETRTASAIERMKAQVERSHPYFEDAYAMAVWPGITRLAFGFGGAYGKGLVVEQDEAVGTVSYWQFSRWSR